MKRLTKTLKGLWEIAKNPWLLNKVLEQDDVWFKTLEKRYGLTNTFPVINCKQFFKKDSLNTFGFLGGGSLPTDILLLKSLAASIENCSYFEIGTWRGESVINVADAAKECYTLNLSKQDILDLGLNEKYADLHAFFSKGKENITHLHGNSLNFDFTGLNKKFDLIFIDGDHHYEMVKNDTKRVFESLVHDNTIVVWHDYAHTPEQVIGEVMAGIYEGVPADQRKHLYHVSNTMCAIYIKGDFDTYSLEYPDTPIHKFRLDISLEDL